MSVAVISSITVGELKIHVKTWPAVGPRKAKILFNHGFCEHSDVYDGFMPEFAGQGYEVVIFDQRGAGKTSPGADYAITNEYHVFNDLDHVIEELVKDYDGYFFIWGHSMGGGIVLNYGVKGKHRDRVDGYIAFAPLVKVHKTTMPNFFMKRVLYVMATVYPKFRAPTNVNYDLLSTDLQKVEEARNDKDRKNMCSAEQMRDMFDRGLQLLKPEYVEKFVDKPVACFHGTGDQVNDFEATEQFFNLLNVKDKTFFKYKDYYHEFHNEAYERREQVKNDALTWLNNHVAEPKL